MKKLTITSDEENIFFLDSKRIVDTELTLIVSEPNNDAEWQTYLMRVSNIETML